MIARAVLAAVLTLCLAFVGLQQPRAQFNGCPPGFCVSAASSGPFSTWNPADKLSVVLSNGNLTYANSGSTNQGVRSTIGKSSGKLYFEITNVSTASRNDTGFGIATSGFTFTTTASAGATFWTLVAANGGVFFNGVNQSKNLGAMAANDIICFAIDLVNSRGWIRHNAGNWLADVSANPATNTNGVDISGLFPSNAAFILGTSNETINSTAGTLNVGATAFGETVPSGFSAWNFLLRRDLDPAANDNLPMWIEAAA